MAHKASKISQHYMEKYLRERGVPLHNKRVGELSQLAERMRTCNCPYWRLPLTWNVPGPKNCGPACDTQTLNGPCQWVDFEPYGSASCEHSNLGDLFNGCLQLKRRCCTSLSTKEWLPAFWQRPSSWHENTKLVPSIFTWEWDVPGRLPWGRHHIWFGCF